MTNLDKRPVYQDTKVERSFKNALYFFVKYTNDCAICLDFFESPQILPCGHCFCRLCITTQMNYSKNCALCGEFFWIFKPVQLFFAEEIKDYILLKRFETLQTRSALSERFYENPGYLEYFEKVPGNLPVEKNAKNSTFYQSSDGQLVFLAPKALKHMKSYPEFIFGKIRHKMGCMINYDYYPELSHIPSGTYILIVEI